MLLPVWSAASRVFDGRRVLLVWPVARVARRWVQRLRTLGCPPPVVLGLHEGSAPPLDLPPGHVHVLQPGPLPPDTPEDPLFDRFEAAVRALPASVQAAIDAWDPEGSAVVITPSAAQLTHVAGRRVFGGTPPVRAQLEDKSRIDALFEGLGIAVPPHRVVPLADAEGVARHLDQGLGTVWAGDNTTTIEAGAFAVVWVRDPASRAFAQARLGGRCARVRVQPFLDGTPCSIQGICTPDGVALTRTTEMLVLRDPAAGEFRLAGLSTTWDPPPAVAEALAAIARQVGRHLLDVHGWRGGFSVDAVATPAGRVWPTELNARMSAGLALVDGCLPGPSLELVERLLREGEPIGVTAAHLEAWMARPLAARRLALVRVPHVAAPSRPRERAVGFDPPRLTAPTEAADARLRWDGEVGRGVVSLTIDPTRHPRGMRLGPRVADALHLAADLWGLPLRRWRSA